MEASSAKVARRGCPAERPGRDADNGPGDDVVMIIRHGEKPRGTGPPYGVTADGVPDRGSLTVVGWARAGALVDLFAPPVGPLRPGLFRPASVFASNLTGPGGGSAREEQTVRFLAARLVVRLNTDYGVGEEEQLLAALASTRGPSLICWAHDDIPTIADRLGEISPPPPPTWPDDRFDVVWVFVKTRGEQGAQPYRFYQVVELVLPGDRETPIG
jgi:hypothetical protein